MQNGGTSGAHSEADPVSAILAAGFIAVLSGGGAIYLWHLFGWRLNLDINDPDFNPLALVVLALLAVSLWHGVSALRWLIRARRSGRVRLDLEGGGQVRLGQILAGRIVSERPVAAKGDFRLELTCYDVHEFREEDAETRLRSFPVWSAEARVDAAQDTTKGLPFRFTLPATVGPKPVPSGIVPGAGVQSLTTIHIPGMRRVVEATNRPPVARHWVLKVTAPVAGPDFLAELSVDVQE